MKNSLAKKNIEDCKNIVASGVTISPCEFRDADDFCDAFVDDAKRVYGKMNAAMLSAVGKMASDDWKQYQQC